MQFLNWKKDKIFLGLKLNFFPHFRSMCGVGSGSSLPNKCSPRSVTNQTTDCILPAAGPSLPGENLPEHHFKKRYFKTELSNQSRDRSQDSATPTSNISSASKTRNGSPSNSSTASPNNNNWNYENLVDYSFKIFNSEVFSKKTRQITQYSRCQSLKYENGF